MNTGKVVQVNGNMVTVQTSGAIKMNEIGYITVANKDMSTKLKSEVIRIKGNQCDMQVFEDTRGILVGNNVDFTSELLSIDLGPGLLNNVYDGLGNPLEKLAEQSGVFLQRGLYLSSIHEQEWDFAPVAKNGDLLKRGQTLGIVKEGDFDHHIMVPFSIADTVRVENISSKGRYKTSDTIAQIKNTRTSEVIDVNMVQSWGVKKAINFYDEKLAPSTPLATRMRIVDVMFPIAEGGTACIPGPFGSGKTVFQQAVSKYGDADIVIVAACGERAGEVVETLREFPDIIDPKTGKSLMERTIIICNTSSMPVAAREASVYTAVTMGEYYRHMGLKVLILADSTSRWAQALREMSGRLEEIPGEEAFPAYLSSLIAGFYERAGLVVIDDPNLGKRSGSITLIGTVSPAGGNFEEPVTQSTLAVVGCFWGLTYARSYAKRFPAISPVDSWSKYMETMKKKLDDMYYPGFVENSKELLKYYLKGQIIGDQMKVVGEEDLSLVDYIHFQKSEFFDAAILQQNSFDAVDAGPSLERTTQAIKLSYKIIHNDFSFTKKDEVRSSIAKITSLFRDLNITSENTPEFTNIYNSILQLLKN
jgi:V/A-type H+-transporting ATPase subunit A